MEDSVDKEKNVKKDTCEFIPKLNRMHRRMIAKKMGLFRKENRRKNGFASA
jgi:spore coat protein CotF